MTDKLSPEALGARPALPKRFYKRAEPLLTEAGFVVALDGRQARTPARAPLALPTLALAEAVVAEWNAQGDVIDPTTMPLTRLANVAIDGVAREMDAVAAEIVKYAGSDLLCYRAGHPDRLVARQTLLWDPILASARDDLGARFVLVEGVTFAEQSGDAIEAIASAVPRDGPFVLTAANVVTTLSGSALIALGLSRGWLTPEAAWEAADLDDAWNAELWGQDIEAEARRAIRRAEFMAAATMMALAREPGA